MNIEKWIMNIENSFLSIGKYIMDIKKLIKNIENYFSIIHE